MNNNSLVSGAAMSDSMLISNQEKEILLSPYQGSTYKLATGDIVHYFRKNKLKWGWNGLSFIVAEDKKTATMTGIGIGLEVGHFIAMDYNGVVGFKIIDVKYDSNPRDMFTAILSGTYGFEEGELD